MVIDWLLVLLALAIAWPRGYVLIYLIDRTKSMSFGFKFFAGWMLGLAGFTADVFALNAINGFALTPLAYVASSLSQIFGFGFMVWLFERRVLLPDIKKLAPFLRRQWQALRSWTTLEKVLTAAVVAVIVCKASLSLWTVANIPTYEFDAWNNWNLRAKVIYEEKNIPLDPTSAFYLAGGIRSYPFNDAMLKAWIAQALGGWQDRYVNMVSIFYYLMLLAIFYVCLPARLSRTLKALAVYLLSSLPLLQLHSHVPYADTLFAIFLLLSISGLYRFVETRGLSLYYFSGIALAFAVWTKNEGLVILFPWILVSSIAFVWLYGVRVKDFLLSWFFAVLTVFPWLLFRFTHRLDILSGDSSSFKVLFNTDFISELVLSIFIRSNFNILWILVLAVVLVKAKSLWRDPALRFLTASVIYLFTAYVAVVLFTDKALDVSALARVIMQISPLALLLLVLAYDRFFGILYTHDPHGTQKNSQS